jgi:hypothetical protein
MPSRLHSAGTIGRVPNQPRTQHRSIRVPDERWKRSDQAASAMDSDRAKVINDFLAWLTHEPGAKLPKRPARDSIGSDQADDE